VRARLIALGLALAPLAVSADEGDGFHTAPTLYWKSGAHRVDLGASLRVRTEMWDAFVDDGDWFTGTRTRLRAQYGWAGKIVVATEFQDVQLHGMGEEANGVALSYRNANDAESHASGDAIRQLFVEARPSESSFLRVGRQDVKLGQEVLYPEPNWRYLKTARLGERLVGTVGWSHVERAYDGASAGWNVAGVQLYGFGARPTTGVFDAETGYRPLHDVALGGATVTVSRGTLLPSSELGVFGLHYRDDRPTDEGGLPDDVATTTFGGHWLGVYALGPGNVDVLLWGALQYGRYADLDHSAAAGIVEIGYQLPGLWSKPWLRAGLNLGTGDGDPSDGDHETFFNVMPTNHLYYGFADQLALQNLDDWFVQLRALPHEKVSLNLFVHWFRLAGGDDARYAGTGAFSDEAFGYVGRPSGGYEHVGVEYDAVATVALHPSATLELGYSWMNGGAMYRTAPSRSLEFFYASLELRY
jgi:hypothetical protein